VTIAITVLLQGGVFVYAAYLGESYAIGRVHIFLIGAVGLGALAGAVKLISAIVNLRRNYSTTVIGKSVTDQDAPGLFSFVQDLARKLEANAPENIVLGLDPTFYVTNCDVNAIGADKQLKGETLYLSVAVVSDLVQRGIEGGDCS
jgi:hypothetical protein